MQSAPAVRFPLEDQPTDRLEMRPQFREIGFIECHGGQSKSGPCRPVIRSRAADADTLILEGLSGHTDLHAESCVWKSVRRSVPSRFALLTIPSDSPGS